MHAWLKLEKKVNIGDPKLFDIEGYHPNLQGCRSNADVVKYVVKDKDYVSNMSPEEIRALVQSRE